MRITKLYYLLGGKKNSFLYRKWYNYHQKKQIKHKRELLQKLGNEALDAMKAACNEAKVPFWLEFGTLLGAYREHGFIPYDDDLDVGMWVDDCTRDFENLLLKYGFQKIRAFYLCNKVTNENKLTEIALNYKGLQIDIFFNDKININQRVCYVYCAPLVDGMFTVREFILPNFSEMETLNINNNTYMVPSNPSETLKMLYGNDFMTPREGANATKSINNHVRIHNINELYGLGYLIQ